LEEHYLFIVTVFCPHYMYAQTSLIVVFCSKTLEAKSQNCI
jgi:hypothetical protein